MKPDILSTFTPTFAEALAAIRLLDGLSPRLRRGLIWALRTAPRILGKAPEDMLLDENVPLNLDDMPASTDLGRQSLHQLRSNLKRAARETAHIDADGFVAARRLIATESPTLDHVVQAISLQNWDRSTKARTVTAIERIATAVATPLAAIPARPAEVEAILGRLAFTDLKVASATWNTMKSRIRRAAGLVNGRTVVRQDDLDADWAALWNEIEAAYPEDGWRLAELWPIARFATRHGLAPEAIDDGTIAAMIGDWREKGISDPIERAQRCTRAWNDYVGSALVPTFPQRCLTVPTKVPRYSGLALRDMPAAFREAWAAYERDVSAPVDDLLAAIVDDGGSRRGRFDDILAAVEGSPDPAPSPLTRALKPGTLRNHRTHVLRAATAAVDAGLMPLAAITSPERLLTPAVLAATLEAVAAGQKRHCEKVGEEHREKNSYLASFCDTFSSIADTFGVPARTRDAFRQMRDRVDPRIVNLKIDTKTGKVLRTWAKSWMGPSHLDMLRQFDDPAKLVAWADLPGRLVARVEARRRAGRKLKRRDIVDVEIAIVLRILRAIPVRRANVGTIRIHGPDPTLRMPTREGMPAHLYWAPAKVKNWVEIEAELDPRTVDLLRLFLTEYRPRALVQRKSAPDNPYLFPGAGANPKGLCKLQGQFAQRCRKLGGFHLDLQCCRHLAASIILNADPSLIDMMSEVLGHRKVETTRKYYARIRRLTVLRRFREMMGERIRELGDRKPVWTGRHPDAEA